MANQHTKAKAAADKASAGKAQPQAQPETAPAAAAVEAPPAAPAPEETAATPPETPPPAHPTGPIRVRALADGYGGIPVAFRKKGEEFPVAEADLGRWMQRLDGNAGTTSPSTAGAAAPEGNAPTGDQSVI